MKYPLVRVVWRDACHIDNCTLEEAQAKQLPVLETVGYLISKNKERVVLMQEVERFDDGTCGSDKYNWEGNGIPIGMILKLEKIKVCLPRKLRKVIDKM